MRENFMGSNFEWWLCRWVLYCHEWVSLEYQVLAFYRADTSIRPMRRQQQWIEHVRGLALKPTEPSWQWSHLPSAGDLAVTDEEYAYPGEKQQRDVELSSPLEGEYAYPSKVRRVEDDKDVVVDVEFTYSGKKQL
uniref:Uncharacterized protein n=1 Tax=Moniliophthora roreri TaxID=221103 RepID=A0A0W0G7V2_MONRR